MPAKKVVKYGPKGARRKGKNNIRGQSKIKAMKVPQFLPDFQLMARM